ncbi:hypothetical protein FWH58_02365 [Candidatus Saccharibacteria bacterium]|nr:hypothetical protein [Candidatus Saccharibacteria bacterium]
MKKDNTTKFDATVTGGGINYARKGDQFFIEESSRLGRIAAKLLGLSPYRLARGEEISNAVQAFTEKERENKEAYDDLESGRYNLYPEADEVPELVEINNALQRDYDPEVDYVKFVNFIQRVGENPQRRKRAPTVGAAAGVPVPDTKESIPRPTDE